VLITPSPGFHFVFSVLAKRLAGKSVSKMACLVLSEMLNLNSINIIVISLGLFLNDLEQQASKCRPCEERPGLHIVLSGITKCLM